MEDLVRAVLYVDNGKYFSGEYFSYVKLRGNAYFPLPSPVLLGEGSGKTLEMFLLRER